MQNEDNVVSKTIPNGIPSGIPSGNDETHARVICDAAGIC